MKGKLYKDNDIHYYLIVDDKIIADSDGHPLSSITNKLSLKNCQAIERGYDLDELADRMIIREENITPEIKRWLIIYFKLGFQKCLEILGDKKYSEGQLLNVMDLVWQWMNGEDYGCKTLPQVQDKHIQSLQQTEWDVEVEMESNLHIGEVADDSYPKGFPTQKPKLDADGCLILKKITNEN